MRFLHFLLVLFCVIAPFAVLGNPAETAPPTPTPTPATPAASTPTATVVDVSPIIQLLEKNQQQLTQSLQAVSTSVSSIKESTASSLSSELNKIISEQSASFSSVKESLKSLSSQYNGITEKLNEVAAAAAAAQSAAANPAATSGVSNEAVVAEIKQLAAELTKILTESNSYSTAIMTHVANANIDLKAKGEKLLSMAQLIEENRATLKLLLEKIEGSNNAQQAQQQSSTVEKSIESINKQLAAIQEKLSAQDALLNAVKTASNQSVLDNVYLFLNNARNHAFVYYENALRFAKHSYDVYLPAFIAAAEHSSKQLMEQAENLHPVVEDGLLQAKIELEKIHQQLIDIFVAKGVPAENAPLVAYSVLGLAIFIIALLALFIIQKILSLIFSVLCYVLCCGGCRKRKPLNNKKTSNVVNSAPLKPAAPKSVPAPPTTAAAPSNIPTPASKKK